MRTQAMSPKVSIIMPTRNEVHYIERSINSVLNQTYSGEDLELIVVDGMSDDGTREYIAKFSAHAKEHTLLSPRILLLDNPEQITPTAFNRGIQQAQGDIVIIMSGHCEIAPDYVERCVEALDKTGADCVGGPMVTLGETKLARAIALAQSSRFGVGGVAFRTGHSKPGYVDTVAFGAYRSSVFKRIGVFDEELVRNQDDEFNFRLTQSGGKIWLDPTITSVYYSRATLGRLWKQYFQYGLYKVRLIQKRQAVPSWRHLVPAAFVLSLIGTLFLALTTRKPRRAFLTAGPYILANVATSLWVGKRLYLSMLLSLIFLILHGAYGLGFLWGIWYWRKQF